MVFPVVLCGCDTLSLTKKGNLLGVFMDKVLMKMFGPKKGSKRKLEKLHS